MTVDHLEAPSTRPAELVSVRRGAGTDVACRTLDIVVSVVALILFLPVLIVVAVAIRLDSRGPAVFRQARVGHRRRPFTVRKFRTMRHGAGHDAHREYVLRLIAGEEPEPAAAEAEPGCAGRAAGAGVAGGPKYKMSDDDRVTRLGRHLRRTSIDELPQLWNVLRGDMSLVGPRPPIPYEVTHYPDHWFARFAVKPGLTGLWQVSGRSQLTLEEMIRLDVEYVERRSLTFNLWILVRTVPAVLNTRGAS